MVGVQRRYALRDHAKEKIGDAMRCKQCGSSDVIPVVSGSPSDVGFRAEMLGLVRFGGVSTGMLPIWYCSSCRMEFSSDDAEGHEMATNNAIEAASRAGNEWLDSQNAQEIAMGRQVYERLISDFRLVGATAVRLSSDGEVSAKFEGEYEPMEWPLAIYGKQVLQALSVGACDTSTHSVSILESTAEITF